MKTDVLILSYSAHGRDFEAFMLLKYHLERAFDLSVQLKPVRDRYWQAFVRASQSKPLEGIERGAKVTTHGATDPTTVTMATVYCEIQRPTDKSNVRNFRIG